jgi:hypothetical protein
MVTGEVTINVTESNPQDKVIGFPNQSVVTYRWRPVFKSLGKCGKVAEITSMGRVSDSEIDQIRRAFKPKPLDAHRRSSHVYSLLRIRALCWNQQPVISGLEK